MRFLALDPGALRLGWALVSGPTIAYHDSGIKGLARGKSEEFGAFRWRLMRYWLDLFPIMLEQLQPDQVVSERLPAAGGGNFIAATQSELAKVAVTTCQIVALQNNVEWVEIAANTIKKDLTGNGRATKVQVRNAVLELIPSLLPRKKELTTYADESDAIGIGIVGTGYKR